MEELANLFHGFAVTLQPFNIMVMVIGIVLLSVIPIYFELRRHRRAGTS